MQQFLSLEDLSHRNLTGPAWVSYYEKAKASFDAHGNGDGIPVGSHVRTLRAGFGGLDGVVRVFQGVYEKDARCFRLSDDRGNDYLSMRELWFCDFQVLEGK
jgi:hypothetical protein